MKMKTATATQIIDALNACAYGSCSGCYLREQGKSDECVKRLKLDAAEMIDAMDRRHSAIIKAFNGAVMRGYEDALKRYGDDDDDDGGDA